MFVLLPGNARSSTPYATQAPEGSVMYHLQAVLVADVEIVMDDVMVCPQQPPPLMQQDLRSGSAHTVSHSTAECKQAHADAETLVAAKNLFQNVKAGAASNIATFEIDELVRVR